MMNGLTRRLHVSLLIVLGAMTLCTAAFADLSGKESLGKQLFFDPDLSSPDGMSCAACHDPLFGFADPHQDQPVSDGVLPLRVGNRNAPTNTYQAAIPDFQESPLIPGLTVGSFLGGRFWDGRVNNLFEQAQKPFLNPVEMHNPIPKLVVHNVKKASYAELFKLVYGEDIFDLKNVDAAYEDIADAITAFENSSEMNKFNSKFDLVLKGEATFTPDEAEGFALFTTIGLPGGPPAPNCALCHDTLTTPTNQPFTDFRYFNIGVPKNPDNPFYTLIPSLNPDGFDFVDLGLGGHLQSIGDPRAADQKGAFKVPTLRNIAKTAPYMHNGVFTTLGEVVHFYNTRDVSPEFQAGGTFGPAEVPDAGNIVGRDPLALPGFIGNMQLTPEQENKIVAFMETLTDDYVP